MKISLCLVVWNELGGCQLDVPSIPREAFHEVYAVDGGSTDGTVEYLESCGIPVHPQTKRGLNAAYLDANWLSTGDAVVVFFPKGTIPVDDLLKFRPLLEAGSVVSLTLGWHSPCGTMGEPIRHRKCEALPGIRFCARLESVE